MSTSPTASEMTCISINYKNSEVDFRKNFAFSQDVQKEFIAKAVSDGFAQGCVLLCTCNRTEVYFIGDTLKMSELVAVYGNLSPQLLASKLMIFNSDRALTHLFSVACGIDSQVMGEDEILGQTKSAYALAKEWGATNAELNMIFQNAVATAKKIKTCTALSKTSVSTATLAANEAARLGENVNVLVMGATGKIGSVVVKNLLSHKNINVTATMRSHCSDLKLLSNNPKIRTVDYSDRYACMNSADCVISATSSPHYTVTAHELRQSITHEKNRLFIDLAVPRDIDTEAEKIPGVSLIDMDYFDKLARENNLLKMDSATAAEQIIGEDIEELKKELIFHRFLPRLDSIKSAAKNRSAEEIIYRLKATLTAREFYGVLEALDSMGGAD